MVTGDQLRSTLGPTQAKALSTGINYNQLSAPLRIRRYVSLPNCFLPFWASGVELVIIIGYSCKLPSVENHRLLDIREVVNISYNACILWRLILALYTNTKYN
jgi:hypothetical protein